MTIEVIVGNIGTVFYQENSSLAARAMAHRIFNDYVARSKDAVGRAAGESVTLFEDGEIAQEHIGSVDELA